MNRDDVSLFDALEMSRAACLQDNLGPRPSDLGAGEVFPVMHFNATSNLRAFLWPPTY